MSDEIKIVTEEKTRRSAIKTAAQVAVTAPAVVMLLSASTKSASALTYVPGAVSDDGITINDDNFSTNAPGPGDSFYGDDITVF